LSGPHVVVEAAGVAVANSIGSAIIALF
jgi:hypothetical protein